MATRSTGSASARPGRSPRSCSTADPARGAATSTAASGTRRATTCCCSTSAAAAVRPRSPASSTTPPGTSSPISSGLREMCGHEKWQVFGGSWGSTLSLAYAETHPERVTEIIMRGIFLCEQSELDWLYKYGASELYPEEWERFVAPRHGARRDDLLETYIRLLDDPDPQVRKAAASAWNRWEGVTVTLLPEEETIEHMADGDNAVATRAHRNALLPAQVLARSRAAAARRGQASRHSRRDRPGPPRLLHPALGGMGAQEGVAGGRPADRARRRATCSPNPASPTDWCARPTGSLGRHADDPGRRQLRQLHLQPGPLPDGTGRRGAGRAQRRADGGAGDRERRRRAS